MYIPKIDLVLLMVFIGVFNVYLPLYGAYRNLAWEDLIGYSVMIVGGALFVFVARFIWRKGIVKLFGEFKWKK